MFLFFLQLCENTEGCVGVEYYPRYDICELYGTVVTGSTEERNGCTRHKCFEFVPVTEQVLVCQ